MAITLLNSPTANAISPTVNKNSARQNTSLLELSTGTRLVYPSSDPAAAAMTNVIRANVAVIHQCVNNADQGAALTNVASSGLNDLISLNVQGQVLCTQVINGSLDVESRAIAQQSIEAMFGPGGSTEAIINTCRFGDKALLNGEKAIQKAYLNNTPITAAIINLGTIPANTFGAGLMDAGATVGTIEGTADSVEATESTTGAPAGSIDLTINIGTETYIGKNLPTAAAALWSLYGKNNGSILTLNSQYAAATPATTVQGVLRSILGVGTQNPAIFVAGASGAQDATMSIQLDAHVSPGVYSIGVANVSPLAVGNAAPAAAAITLSVSNGVDGSVITPPGAGATAIPAFPGMTVTFSAAPAAAIANFRFEVKNDMMLDFQTGSQPTDLTKVSLPKIDLTSLHYVKMDVSTMEAAADTAGKLKYGMGVLNDVLAQIGAAQARLITAGSSAETLEENMKNAGSTYSDANPISSMIEFQQSSILLNNAIASTTPSMSSLRTLSSQIQQTFASVA